MPTVLLIDDDLDFVEATCTVLESVPYAVLVAHNGPEGLALAREAHPDVIILDVILPGEDGFSILEKLRADPALTRTPVMMLTSLPDGIDLTRLEETETSVENYDYVDKPIRPAELLRRVERLLGSPETQPRLVTRDTKKD
jgi:CheY-like chemotaxis protein